MRLDFISEDTRKFDFVGPLVASCHHKGNALNELFFGAGFDVGVPALDGGLVNLGLRLRNWLHFNGFLNVHFWTILNFLNKGSLRLLFDLLDKLVLELLVELLLDLCFQEAVDLLLVDLLEVSTEQISVEFTSASTFFTRLTFLIDTLTATFEAFDLLRHTFHGTF